MKQEKKGTLKELWKNDKSRSLITLSFYLLFIFILIVGIRTSPKTPKKEEPVEKKEEVIETIPYSELKNYEYVLKIGEHVLEGKRFYEKELLKEENNIYFYEDGLFYQVIDTYKEEMDDHLYNIPLSSLRPEILSSYMVKQNIFYEQSYEDGTKEVTYRIPNVDMGITEEGFVNIETKEKDQIMESVILQIKGETIQITYRNQNSLKDLVLPELEEKI